MVEGGLQPLVKRGLEIGYCARPGAVDVRLTASGTDAEKLVRDGEAVVQKILGANIFGFDDDEIENVVVRLLTRTKKNAGAGGILHGRKHRASRHECAGRVGGFSRRRGQLRE